MSSLKVWGAFNDPSDWALKPVTLWIYFEYKWCAYRGGKNRRLLINVCLGLQPASGGSNYFSAIPGWSKLIMWDRLLVNPHRGLSPWPLALRPGLIWFSLQQEGTCPLLPWLKKHNGSGLEMNFCITINISEQIGDMASETRNDTKMLQT